MATSISSIGVGSGLPLDTLLENLRLAENAPLAALASRTSAEKQRLSAYGTLKNALEGLSSTANALGKGSAFNAVTSTVTGDSFTATAKADSGAISGNHSISVQQLATAQVLASGRVTSNNQAVAPGATGTANLSLTVGEGGSATTHSLSVAADASLQDIARAINADSELDFSATLMNDGIGQRLIISSNETGAQNAITNISVELGDDGAGDISSLQNALSYNKAAPTPDGMAQTVEARNALVTINGVQVTSQDNVLEDAIEGVTLTLKKEAAAGAPADTLQVVRDNDATVKLVEDFVKSYNSLQNSIRSLTSYNVETQTGAALTGDSLARRVQTQMRDSINGLSANGITLSSIGITTDPTNGNLTVDTEKLTAALSENRANVQELFTGENGLSKRVIAAAETYTKSDGLLKTSQDGIQQTIRQLEKQYEQMEMRIDQKMETYRAQFVQLDGFVAQMGGIASYLTQQLATLGSMNSSSK